MEDDIDGFSFLGWGERFSVVGIVSLKEGDKDLE